MTERPRLNVSAAHLRPALPLLALLLLGLAAWLAWTGFQQSRDAQGLQALEQSRDQVAQGTARALQAQAARLQQGLATPAVQSALASGQLAAAEAALAAAGPVSRIVKDDGIHLAVAAPAQVGEALVAVAYARLPLALATTALQGASIAGDSYLALRQGNYTLVERGNIGLAGSAASAAASRPKLPSGRRA